MARKFIELPSCDDRPIWDLWLSYNIYPAACAAEEIGLFPLLNSGPMSTDEVAEGLSISRDWAEVLLGVLATQSLVRFEAGRFQLTEVARVYLLPESPFFKGPPLRALRDEGRIDRVVAAIRGSNPKADQLAGKEWKEGELSIESAKIRSRTMHALSFPSALGMAKAGDFQGVKRLLDVAGGSGGFCIALAMRYPDIRCTIAELPVMCEVANEFVAEFGLEDQVDTAPVNMFNDDWPTGYDAILLSNVLHDWDYPRRADLINRAFVALPSGGRIYIHEMLTTDSADGPSGAALFSFGMLLGTWGKQFSAPEMRRDLEAAGFTDVSVQNTYGYYSLVIGRKP